MSDSTPKPPNEPVQTPVTPPSAAGAAVLFVVDDDVMVGDVVEAILGMGGYKTVFFSEPSEAFKAFKDGPVKPDLLLTDFQMPGMTGRELIQRCKEIQPSLKTILYSGNVDEDTVQMYPARPDTFLRKPFTPKRLLDLVAAVLADRPPNTSGDSTTFRRYLLP